MEMKKKLKFSPTNEGTLDFVKWKFKSSHKTIETRTFKTSHCLKFFEALIKKLFFANDSMDISTL
jgi:hypothetical protein